jgi:hypothetical protein
LFVILFIAYTSLFITSHKTEIKAAFGSKWDQLNEDWKHHSNYFNNITSEFKTSFRGSKSFLNEYAEFIKNKTNDYYSTLDDKLNQYREFFNEKIK